MTVSDCMHAITHGKNLSAKIELKFKTLTEEENAHIEMVELLDNSRNVIEELIQLIGNISIDNGQQRFR
jgi:hypothetical protein